VSAGVDQLWGIVTANGKMVTGLGDVTDGVGGLFRSEESARRGLRDIVRWSRAEEKEFVSSLLVKKLRVSVEES